MKIWYVVGDVEYWLEPEFQSKDNIHFRVMGCKLYDPNHLYKGYWRWYDIPLAVKRNIRSVISEALKHERVVKAREKHYVRGHYRHNPERK